MPNDSSARVLYVGLDPPPGVFHYPVICTERIESLALREALALWDRFTHVIFTSRSGVRHWGWLRGMERKCVIAIGPGTASELLKCKELSGSCERDGSGASPLLAPEATQEGVISLLDTLPLQNTFFFYPRSSRARPCLAEYLRRRKVAVYLLDLYETILQKPEPVPDLRLFDEIIFTSPSTVDGFLQIFGRLPGDKKLRAIGPVTQKALMEKNDFHKVC